MQTAQTDMTVMTTMTTNNLDETLSGPSLIIPRLYLSDYFAAADEALLVSLGITHVVSAMEWPPEYKSRTIKTLRIKVEDTFRTDILQHLDVTTAYIKAALAENETNKVLVRTLSVIATSRS